MREKRTDSCPSKKSPVVVVSARLKTTGRGVIASLTRVSRNNSRFFSTSDSRSANWPSSALSSAIAANSCLLKPLSVGPSAMRPVNLSLSTTNG